MPISRPPPFSVDVARSALEYDPKDGVLRWRIDHAPRARAGDEAGTVCDGYIRLRFRGFNCRAHNMIWFIVTGRWPTVEIDHRDRDGLNNRWTNFRAAGRLGNAANTSTKCNSTTGLKGVSPNPNGGKWRARIVVGGKRVHIGSFDTPAAAAKAYDHYAAKARGQFAFLNFPDRLSSEPVLPPRPKRVVNRRVVNG